MQELRLYQVQAVGGFKLRIQAKDSTQAKRIYCKKTGRRPGDTWCGMTSLKASLVKEAV